MVKKISGLDQLFIKAEELANDFSLFPNSGEVKPDKNLEGLVEDNKVDSILKGLRNLKVDKYIEKTVQPTEDKSRISARAVLKMFDGEIIKEQAHGPLYVVEMFLNFASHKRRVGFIAQDRNVANGVWMPEHHNLASNIVNEFIEYSIPIITLIDTPGADADEIANRNNQAHSISRLISTMAIVPSPTVGIILGNGYSGGAIPLATTNILLSVRDGVFNTIQPRGLASIARKYNLSWQECAKYVGVSSYELYRQGYLDGVIDYVPGEAIDKHQNLQRAIVSSIISIENRSKEFINNNAYVFDHYIRSVDRFLNPNEIVIEDQYLALPQTPTSHLNIFGTAIRYLRYLNIRNKLKSTTIELYGRLSDLEIPEGDLGQRIEKEHRDAFKQWLNSPLEIKYDDALGKSWKNYQYFKERISNKRGKFAKMILGDPAKNFQDSEQDLQFSFTFHLYNLWKTGAQNNFVSLIKYLIKNDVHPDSQVGDLTILDVMLRTDVREGMILESKNLIIFDLIYNNIVANLNTIAREASEHDTISKKTLSNLIDDSLPGIVESVRNQLPKEKIFGPDNDQTKLEFENWLRQFVKNSKRHILLKSIEEWKKIEFPRYSETLFAIITFIFDHLLHQYYESEQSGKKFEGRISLRNIGMKDFWNRLTIAYHDLLINDLLTINKRSKKTTTNAIIDKFLTNFEEHHTNLMTSDPVGFPGFRISIEQSLSKNITPCGIITGIAQIKCNKITRKAGVIISNLDFQAGAFDMASAEKFCKLLVECAAKKLSVVCFLSSGGMQTKEGAGALFSMAIVNDRITRFIRDTGLQIICFGFGDCTGGAQASFVTHPLVQTYYFSGTNMPFAGQIVVPSYLPSTSTLSNYLSKTTGAMQGLVKHPFFDDLDDQLRTIDTNIPVAKESVEDVLSRIFQGILVAEDDEQEVVKAVHHLDLMQPVKRVLIHARGCTAVKLIRIAQKQNIEVVLVQSDADMDSVAADMLTDKDRLVCLGGNTSDESYLNAQSVVRIAEREEADSLHPGIGFLSENPLFAALCQNHRLNFIGPPVESMEQMGNKSNAINTALDLKIAVVPGSHGIITSPEAAQRLSEKVGYPIVIKAVHGGGGKGIKMVDSSENFREIFIQMKAEAKSAFGNSDVYIEKCVTSLRHIEVQILRDKFGNTKVLGLRDCSVQRNNQKIIEESGSTSLPKNLEKEALKYAEAISDRIGYIGAGTVEFIHDLKCEAVYFMEMNTRLQVEHPVTETVTDIDIVATQFDIAAGESIEKMKVSQKDYAIEVRINAEKAAINPDGEFIFIPEPGEITEFEFPENKNIDVISAMGKGKIVPTYYDSMIVQLICKGKDRNSTIKSLIDYLGTVKIEGICTNIPLLKAILSDEIFQNGVYDTTYLPKFIARIDTKKLIKEIENAAGDVKQSFDLDSLKIEGSDEIKVLAPSTGIFYITPSPTEPEFVKIGDIINTTQTLCLIEAMKVFRPISLNIFNNDDGIIYSENKKYKVVRVNPANAQAVNTGDLLFIIKPE